MELKRYQKKVIDDLVQYMQTVNDCGTLDEAWQKYWNEKGAAVGVEGKSAPRYDNSLVNVPHVCMKVPTGGGKTFLACCSLKKIYDERGVWGKPRFVIWLVPSDAILEQTVKNLKNPAHPYRQRLNTDFKNRVEVYQKDELLFAQNFSPDTVREQLTIAVMSYASVRIDKTKKDSRKVYQENGNLLRFAEFFKDKDKNSLLADTPDTALIQVMRYFEPVVIVDESHNAGSVLSVEMLKNLNPSFVLDLTATPKANSNVISYVAPVELKKEHMVKLPVVAYNRNSRESVVENAICLRRKLEEYAVAEMEKSGTYVRPIVLFQAQPKNSEDSETFEKLKEKLVAAGIAKEQIAIKTSNVNELKDVDLLSQDCLIRYIITVNALKEGWDCPFAYILASVANKTSQVDVEQIVGRILRQPHTKQFDNKLLNMSYVITNSADFYGTLGKLVDGLNAAGFGERDCKNGGEEKKNKADTVVPTQTTLEDTAENNVNVSDDFGDISSENIAFATDENNSEKDKQVENEMLKSAEAAADSYDNELNKDSGSEELYPIGISDFQHISRVRPAFEDEIKELVIPQFVVPNDSTFVDEKEKLLEPEHLSNDFRLARLQTNIPFDAIDTIVYSVDIEDGTAKYRAAQPEDKRLLREQLSALSSAAQLEACISRIVDRLNKIDRYSYSDIKTFVKHVVETMDSETLDDLKENLFDYTDKIATYIKGFEKEHRYKTFSQKIDNENIRLGNTYRLPLSITPHPSTSSIADSLYETELKDMNPTEIEILNRLLEKCDIVWWHRIMERKPQEFRINGFVNHYPDFMMRTRKGKILMIEVKGEQLKGPESQRKLELGRKWAFKAGDKFRYFMIFKDSALKEDGAYQLDEFIQTMKDI